MTLENRLIPILREGINLIKMVLFKIMRDGLAKRYPHQERTFINQLTGAMINELFCTPNHEEPFLSFAINNRPLIEEGMKRIADDFPELRIPLTDALRVQFLCDSQEGLAIPVMLTQARDLGILITERDIPLPDHFMTMARSLGEGSHVIHQVNIGSA
ncbi:MAG: hypothetical protein WCJ37_06410 [Syntrophus sp. (in: bacteria)]